jgi:hypothetical protein
MTITRQDGSRTRFSDLDLEYITLKLNTTSYTHLYRVIILREMLTGSSKWGFDRAFHYLLSVFNLFELNDLLELGYDGDELTRLSNLKDELGVEGFITKINEIKNAGKTE